MSFIVKDLTIKIGNKLVVQKANLILRSGQITALMGPNGSGKSSLGYALMGHPNYATDSGICQLWFPRIPRGIFCSVGLCFLLSEMSLSGCFFYSPAKFSTHGVLPTGYFNQDSQT